MQINISVDSHDSAGDVRRAAALLLLYADRRGLDVLATALDVPAGTSVKPANVTEVTDNRPLDRSPSRPPAPSGAAPSSSSSETKPASATVTRLPSAPPAPMGTVPPAPTTTGSLPAAPSATIPAPPAATQGTSATSAATAPPAASGAPSATVDKSGLPWDERINSSPPALNKSDGLWRRKRNLDDAEYERVRGLLLASVSNGAGGASASRHDVSGMGPAPAPVGGAPVPSGFMQQLAANGGTPPAPQGQSKGNTQLPPPPPPAGKPAEDEATAQAFRAFAARLAQAASDKKYTPGSEDEKWLAVAAGASDLTELLTKPELLPAANAALDTLLAHRA